MLQRVLAGFVRLEGVEQAMLIDDSGQLLASVGEEGILPPCLLYTSPSPRDRH